MTEVQPEEVLIEIDGMTGTLNISHSRFAHMTQNWL